VFFLNGLYFGVLCRDFADYMVEKLTSKVAAHVLAMTKADPAVCAICGRFLGDVYKSNERTLTISCGEFIILFSHQLDHSLLGHEYHEYCLYGWALVGKRDTCPFCKENASISTMFGNSPLQKPAYFYGRILLAVRYLVLWFPLLFLAVDLTFYFLDAKFNEPGWETWEYDAY